MVALPYHPEPPFILVLVLEEKSLFLGFSQDLLLPRLHRVLNLLLDFLGFLLHSLNLLPNAPPLLLILPLQFFLEPLVFLLKTPDLITNQFIPLFDFFLSICLLNDRASKLVLPFHSKLLSIFFSFLSYKASP